MLVFTVALAVTAFSCLSAAEREGAAAMTFEYGFRYDPMEFVENDDTLQGALVRRLVFEDPLPGDSDLLAARIEEILAEQNADGTLSDDPRHRYQFTAERLIELGQLGVDPQREEVQRAVWVVLSEKDEETADPHGIYTVRALCLLGLEDMPQVREGLQRTMDRQEEWNGPYKGCPWTPIEHLKTLWYGRDVVDSSELIAGALGWIADGINGAGCLTYKDPWGLVDCAGLMDVAEAKRIVQKEVPVILRGQKADGGWGGRSLSTFRALVNHGLLEQLRQLPPVPDDWRIVREIPAPGEDPFSLTYGDGYLWTLDREAEQIVAVSPADGSVVRRLELPIALDTVRDIALGWWDGALGLVQTEPKKLLKVDPETGDVIGTVSLEALEWPFGFTQIGDEIWIYDAWQGCTMRVDPKQPEKRQFHGHTGTGAQMTGTGDSLWCVRDFSPVLVHTDTQGRMLDWGEAPFGGECNGLAWDGENLWALDTGQKRICVIEKAEATAAKAGAGG